MIEAQCQSDRGHVSLIEPSASLIEPSASLIEARVSLIEAQRQSDRSPASV